MYIWWSLFGIRQLDFLWILHLCLNGLGTKRSFWVFMGKALMGHLGPDCPPLAPLGQA